jgi:UDP-N-acetylglucosamine 1-carboxyvinyltransferase
VSPALRPPACLGAASHYSGAMDRIIIRGGNRLEGRVPISGAKNAALTLLPCALLTDQPLTLTNLPRLADVEGFGHLMNELGVSTTVAGQRGKSPVRAMTLNADTISSTTAPYEIVRKMRASILVLGPLLAREGEATVSLPGGCAIGNRPIDLHLKALEALGAEIELAAGYVRASAPSGGLKGGHIIFPIVSVGATENALMAAALATGETVIENAAREPEIADLCKCLVAMGSEISGIGSERLVIQGKSSLHGATHRVMPDRIEAGSYACAAGITGGDLLLEGACMEDMAAIVAGLSEAGLVVTEEADGIRVSANGRLCPLTLSTAPFPAFPTDMQAQFMAMLTLAEGTSVLTETIFENRYMHVPELTRMGADIHVHGRTAIVKGVQHLTGAPVMATDLRASMSLVLAGLAAKGETQVLRVYHLDRGYERLEEKLSAVGANIERDSGG